MEKLYKEIEAVAKELVRIPSVNTTSGEKDIALFIEEYLRDMPYFKEHNDQIIIQELDSDPLNRRNVIAYIKGEKSKHGETILLHGHMDTVGVEDYAALKPYCFDPDQLLEEMLKMKQLPESVRKDLESGDWLVGRGSCDMKSGVAVFLVLFQYFSEKAKELNGNILLSINPVEENLHTGIIEATKVFKLLKDKEGFQYVLAINNDYICPLYEGDTKKYIYTGAVGKLLPCFYIQGKETHVGQCFEGFDASSVAARLVEEINLNTEYCDSYEGEYTLPPSVLKMKDLKPWYNVQTAADAFVYFNYFVHYESMGEIIKKLQQASKKALEEVEEKMNREYRSYCNLSGDTYSEIHFSKSLITYDELYQMALRQLGDRIATLLESKTYQMLQENVDKREIPMYLVKYLLQELKIKDPTIVLYFAAPYCPHNTLKKENKEEQDLILRLTEIINEYAKESEEEYKILQFFPSLSDSSYLKIDDDEESIQELISNFPEYELLYAVPLKNIKKLNIPAVNYGCYGKDAHKWTERVYKPYTFRTLPQLIIKTIEKFL
ncbi:M20/M25/M40 family metallo-hydrolase [Anaeromicropila herbilytica]|uniref:Peptidase M20 n=1 Tax=Anaeromicropila herbilytica TaxID=2785025 RepID=A0A7R7ID36_9FIRM|nr:M20/M25/M40 family metallo-hydrolase [Anaeromicropila herbilytica]BCN31368.1 peptidase M20 [Anaeromicropila herbilytica]